MRHIKKDNDFQLAGKIFQHWSILFKRRTSSTPNLTLTSSDGKVQSVSVELDFGPFLNRTKYKKSWPCSPGFFSSADGCRQKCLLYFPVFLLVSSNSIHRMTSFSVSFYFTDHILSSISIPVYISPTVKVILSQLYAFNIYNFSISILWSSLNLASVFILLSNGVSLFSAFQVV